MVLAPFPLSLVYAAAAVFLAPVAFWHFWRAPRWRTFAVFLLTGAVLYFGLSTLV